MLFALDVTPSVPDPAVMVVSIGGELDVATAPLVRQELLSLAARGHHRVVLDLAGVDFLDSTGLGVVLGALRRARSGGGELALARLEPQVRRVFEITRLAEVMALCADVDSAVSTVSTVSAVSAGRAGAAAAPVTGEGPPGASVSARPASGSTGG